MWYQFIAPNPGASVLITIIRSRHFVIPRHFESKEYIVVGRIIWAMVRFFFFNWEANLSIINIKRFYFIEATEQAHGRFLVRVSVIFCSVFINQILDIFVRLTSGLPVKDLAMSAISGLLEHKKKKLFENLFVCVFYDKYKKSIPY